MEKIKVYEINVTIFAKKSFGFIDANTIISGYVDTCLAKNEEFLKLHQKRGFKFYSMDLPRSDEKGGEYKKEVMYSFRIRCIDPKLLDFLVQELPNTETNFIKGLMCKVKVLPRRHIIKLYTLTPVFIRLQDGGYWKGNISFNNYEEIIKANMVKKLKEASRQSVDETFQFYTSIEKTNRIPIKVNYKNVQLLGDKFDLEIADNQVAQDMAYLALATGLGTGNSRGYGFVNCKYL